MTLKERVKSLCKERGVSMNQTETDLGFGKGYISKLGSSKPNTEKLNRMAEYFWRYSRLSYESESPTVLVMN